MAVNRAVSSHLDRVGHSWLTDTASWSILRRTASLPPDSGAVRILFELMAHALSHQFIGRPSLDTNVFEHLIHFLSGTTLLCRQVHYLTEQFAFLLRVLPRGTCPNEPGLQFLHLFSDPLVGNGVALAISFLVSSDMDPQDLTVESQQRSIAAPFLSGSIMADQL